MDVLFQSGYFSGMFSGAWKESHERTIHIKIPDDNIDQQGIRVSSKFKTFFSLKNVFTGIEQEQMFITKNLKENEHNYL